MRLSEETRRAVVQAVMNRDPAAKVYLYGSRAKADLRGGDIDLLVISEILDFSDKVSILSEIKGVLGEQKIDRLLRSAANAQSDAFVRDVLAQAIRLN